MRADTTAAFFDYPNTKELFAAVVRGEVPPPAGSIGKGSSRQPVWTIEYCRDFVTQRYEGGLRVGEPEDVAHLI